jgi:uncharacterized Zn finger protein (UPF0148 family)
MAAHKHDWVGKGWGKLQCSTCHKVSTVKRVEAAEKAARMAKLLKQSRSQNPRRSPLLKDIFIVD